MNNFSSRLEDSVKEKMLSNLKASLEATKSKMNPNQKAKYTKGVIKAALVSGKVAMSVAGVGAAGMGLMDLGVAGLEAAAQSMLVGDEAIKASMATKSALSSFLSNGLIAGSLAYGVALVDKQISKLNNENDGVSDNSQLKLLGDAIKETGLDKYFESPDLFTKEQVNAGLSACVKYLSKEPDALEFALAWGNALNTKQENNKKLKLS